MGIINEACLYGNHNSHDSIPRESPYIYGRLCRPRHALQRAKIVLPTSLPREFVDPASAKDQMLGRTLERSMREMSASRSPSQSIPILSIRHSKMPNAFRVMRRDPDTPFAVAVT